MQTNSRFAKIDGALKSGPLASSTLQNLTLSFTSDRKFFFVISSKHISKAFQWSQFRLLK